MSKRINSYALAPDAIAGIRNLKKLVQMKNISISELARTLGVSRMAVQQWLKRGIPWFWCQKLEQISEGKFTCSDFRPDKFKKNGELL